MRVRMWLSQETEAVLRREKESYKNTENISVTYGYIVNKMAHEVLEQSGKDIDWKKVRQTSIEYLARKEKTQYSTTLNLEKTVIDEITSLQIQLKKIFDANRVHRAFVLRMLVRAYVLSKQNIDIFVDNDRLEGTK